MTRRCPRCAVLNTASDRQCARCGLPLADVGATMVNSAARRRNRRTLTGTFFTLVALVGMIALIVWLTVHANSDPIIGQGGIVPQVTIAPAFSPTPAVTATTIPATVGTVTHDTSVLPATTDVPVIGVPTVTPYVQPNVIPTPTAPNVPPPTDAPASPTVSPTATLPASAGSLSVPVSPYLLSGAYKRDDGRLYGRPEVALYGTGSDYSAGTVTFTLPRLPDAPLSLDLLGLDDERAEHCRLQIVLNGTTLYDDADTFPNTPVNDNGEGGGPRYWGHMRLSIPAGALKSGANAIAIRNATPWVGHIGIPYILISTATLSVG